MVTRRGWCLALEPACDFQATRQLAVRVRECNSRFSQQHLKAAPVFVSAYLLRLQCQSAGSLKTQERNISMEAIPVERVVFNSVTLLKSSHSFFFSSFFFSPFLSFSFFFFAFPVWLSCLWQQKWGDCSFKFDLFLDVFINWCQNCQSATGLH